MVVHDSPLPVTRSAYHRGSHMEGTVALKHGLVARGFPDHATLRSPLLPLEPATEVMAKALRFAGLIAQTRAGSGEVGDRRAA